MIRALSLAALFGALALPAAAEVQLSFYGGIQEAPHSVVDVTGDSVLPDDHFTAGWNGRSFEMPPYWGARATYWGPRELGFGIDINHAKVYADDETLDRTGYEHFEFTDGLNIITVNAYRRFPLAWGNLTPYVGGGLGVAMPHVEVIDGDSRTWGYQVTGPAATWIAGASYPLGASWSVFGEYKGTYSMNQAELVGGGTLETDIITNALNVGVSFNF